MPTARTFGGASTDAVVTGLSSSSTQRSWSIWSYNTGHGGGSFGRLFDKRTAGANVENLLDNEGGTPGTYQYAHQWSGGNVGWNFTSPSQNAWHHIVVTYDGGSTSNDPIVYVDSVTASLSITPGRPTGTLSTNTDAYVIGNQTLSSTRNWAGRLAEFAVWDTILSASDVTSLWTGDAGSPLQVQPSSLKCYYPLHGPNPEPDISGHVGTATVTGTVIVNPGAHADRYDQDKIERLDNRFAQSVMRAAVY